MVDNDHSDHVRVDPGVPRGTVLYLLYINDLPHKVKSHVRLFADDCLLYRPIRSAADQVLLQYDLQELSNCMGGYLGPEI